MDTFPLDLRTLPLSRAGSYLALSWLPEQDDRPAGLYLRSLRGPLVGADPWQPLLRISAENEPDAGSWQAQTSGAHLGKPGQRLALALETPDTLRIAAEGLAGSLQLNPSGYDYAVPLGPDRWEIVICSAVETRLVLTALHGRIAAHNGWTGVRTTALRFDLLPAADGNGDWLLTECANGQADSPAAAAQPSALPSWSELGSEICAWHAPFRAEVPARFADAAEHAAYVLWSCIVAPAGYLRRPAVYMSKNSMASIWSWDNCFVALALAPHQPNLAWDQLMVMLDLQDPSGRVPDLANDRFVSWSFCKPPVYGWALARLARLPGFLTPERLAEIYPPLCRLTEWWFTYRDANGDGIPQYNHGNESGWDNSTVFLPQPPVDAPDLATYLVLQMEFLAWAAGELGLVDEAQAWQARASGLLEHLLAYFWTGERFVARATHGGAPIPSDSLQLYLPLLLGDRLPVHVRQRLVLDLGTPGRFLTTFGLASESPHGAAYTPDGYWRGPIWGAPCLMLAEGLDAAGAPDLADDVRRRFCALVAQQGLAENYEALTGAPLRDRAFAWTAAAFLVLARELNR